jgi:group I intron endonuclease
VTLACDFDEHLGLPIIEIDLSCCVYVVTCNINNKRYVGISNDPERRWKEHTRRANNPSDPSYNLKLYRAIRKYGWEAFSVEEVLRGSREFCGLLEVSFISIYDSFENGYNSSQGGEGTSYVEPWNKSTKGVCKPNKTSFVKGGKSLRQVLTEDEIKRILQEYDDGIPPTKMTWLPVHWSQAYRVINKHKLEKVG